MSKYLTQDQAYEMLAAGKIEEWNEYREVNKPFKPDFMEFDLSGLDLSDANLTCSDMYKVNLSGCNLTGARLNNAIMYEANLQGADLTDTRFIYCDLGCADLRNATIDRTNLTYTNLNGVKVNPDQVEVLTGCLNLDIVGTGG